MLTEDMDFAIFNELDSSGANWQPNGNFIETNPLQLEDNFQSSGSFSTPELEEIIATNGTKEMEFQWQFPESDLTGNFNSNSAYQWNHGDPLTGNFNSAYQWNHGDPFTGNKAIDSDSTDSTKRDVFTDSEAVLEASVFEARNQLEIFANGEDFFNELNQAFELDVSSTEAKAVIEDLASGETMPKIEILSANELNNANAAFGEETIYVSEEFLSDNSDSLDVVEGVLLEEMGHYVDRELNLFDSPGDEGDIFSQLVRGDTISGAELDDLQAEDDSATISVDGEVISVELAEPSSLEPTPGTDYTELVPIPPDSEINQGLTSPLPEVMYDLIGDPGNAETGEVSPELEELLVTRNVGPFEVSGLTPAVDALERIFTQVKEDNPELYEQLGYSGMYNLRRINSVDTGPIPGTISNHSWGTAIDINIGDDPDFETDGKTDRGLVELAPYFEKEGFYWGAGFDTNEDPMHFEASKELLERWR
ncbi:M15 family metallopeptidase [Pleurocapsa sp. FMAR1]|uniref:M15 family metallopeptidase n=1 Tax=Pleurocapsa sp. FMAR1 TaxID=3040204 RepID=UPI0029C740EB|nr:M15 family metallopeptidase [Pleurocapsa sp. FMAR1]